MERRNQLMPQDTQTMAVRFTERPMPTRSQPNQLHTRVECPNCHSTFTAGFDPNNTHNCPNCKSRFQEGQQSNHGPGCSICSSRRGQVTCAPCSSSMPRGAHNLHFNDGCPAIMSDGRFITNYNSTNELTEQMRNLNGIRNPNEFRNFMQKFGSAFMDAERDHTIRANTCMPQTACSQGWSDLWQKHGGNWADRVPEAFDPDCNASSLHRF